MNDIFKYVSSLSSIDLDAINEVDVIVHDNPDDVLREYAYVLIENTSVLLKREVEAEVELKTVDEGGLLGLYLWYEDKIVLFGDRGQTVPVLAHEYVHKLAEKRLGSYGYVEHTYEELTARTVEFAVVNWQSAFDLCGEDLAPYVSQAIDSFVGVISFYAENFGCDADDILDLLDADKCLEEVGWRLKKIDPKNKL